MNKETQLTKKKITIPYYCFPFKLDTNETYQGCFSPYISSYDFNLNLKMIKTHDYCVPLTKLDGILFEMNGKQIDVKKVNHFFDKLPNHSICFNKDQIDRLLLNDE